VQSCQFFFVELKYTGSLNAVQWAKLQPFHVRNQRRILQIKRDDFVTNEEITEITGLSDVRTTVAYVIVGFLYGHVACLPSSVPASSILHSYMYVLCGKRRRSPRSGLATISWSSLYHLGSLDLLWHQYLGSRQRPRGYERAFSYAGPATWKGLPENKRAHQNREVFKKQLKTYFFTLAFNVHWLLGFILFLYTAVRV